MQSIFHYKAHQMKSITFEMFLNLVNFDAFLPTLVCHCTLYVIVVYYEI
jgi:hypothetical protein